MSVSDLHPETMVGAFLGHHNTRPTGQASGGKAGLLWLEVQQDCAEQLVLSEDFSCLLAVSTFAVFPVLEIGD